MTSPNIEMLRMRLSRARDARMVVRLRGAIRDEALALGIDAFDALE